MARLTLGEAYDSAGEAAVLAGSLGMLPSASLGDRLTKHGTFGLYEPIHGSAPDIAGEDKANPIGTILSAAMLLRLSLGLDDAATAVEAAVNDALLRSGVPVAGTAWQGEAARTLQTEAGIPAETAVRLLHRLRHERPPPGAVLVVDEASTMPTRALTELAAAISAVDGRLILIGDRAQLPSIDAGTQSFGGSNSTVPERRRSKVVSERTGIGAHAVGLPSASTAVTYSSTDDHAPPASRARVMCISRNFSMSPTARVLPGWPKSTSPDELRPALVRSDHPVWSDRLTDQNW